MNKLALQLNKTLGTAADFLSPTGRRMYFPYGGILGQGAEAKSCAINATVGMAFEEDGSPLVMDCFRKTVDLDKRAFLYAGSFGLPKLREAWRAMEFVKNPSLKGKTFSNPVVTNALTHGIRICAELFAGPGDTLVCPDLFWDNYELIFKEAVGCKVELFNTFKKGAFDADAMKKALLAPGKKKSPRRARRSLSSATMRTSVSSMRRASTANRFSPSSPIFTATSSPSSSTARRRKTMSGVFASASSALPSRVRRPTSSRRSRRRPRAMSVRESPT